MSKGPDHVCRDNVVFDAEKVDAKTVCWIVKCGRCGAELERSISTV